MTRLRKSAQVPRSSVPTGENAGAGETQRAHRHPTPDEVAVVRSMAVDVVTAQVTVAFRKAGVRSILLKGPAVARWLYDNGAMRPYVDSDLLVAPTDVAPAERILAGLGFEIAGLESIRGDWPKPARSWIRWDHANVDLHRTFAGVGVDPSVLWGALSERTETMTVAGTEVEVLRPEARALVVALHAAKDGARVAKTIHDLGHAVERVPVQTWERAALLAAELDATGAFATGLRRTAAGEALAERLQLGYDRRITVALRERGAPPLAVGFDWLINEPRFSGKLRLVVRKLVPPTAFLRAWKPLARNGPLGLAAAYVWRPLWVAWHTVPALRAWLRARREVH